MNAEVFELPALEVEPHQVSETLRCLLHTVLFNRALGSVRPRDVDSSLFEPLTWVHCGDDAAAERLETKIARVQAWVDRQQAQQTASPPPTSPPPPRRRALVTLSFFERRQQQGWFLRQEQRLNWEKWVVPLSVVAPPAGADPEPARAARKQALLASIEAALTAIVTGVSERRDHIPPVVSGAPLTFPFDVSVEAEGGAEAGPIFGGVDLVRRMLSSSANPPSVLH